MEYTKDQLNYFRICYIINCIAEGLRQVFIREWNSNYKVSLGEWEDTAQNGQDFYNNESKKPIYRINRVHLRLIKKGKTKEWDCSCLFFAILFSYSIGSTISTTTRKDIEDLRQVRNDIAHISEATLTDTQFQNHVGIVLNAFKSLSLPISDIETVKNQKTFPTAEVNGLKAQAANLETKLQTAKSDFQDVKDAIKAKEDENLTLTSELKEAKEQMKCLTEEINLKVESFCLLTSNPPHKIILRRTEVSKIIGKMKALEERSNGAVSTIYLSGMPGCGKSQIARQTGEQFFTMKSGKSKNLTFVATLNAESLETLRDSYFSLAKKLGVSEYAISKLAIAELESADEIIRHLQRLIRQNTNLFYSWLMIADNVEDLLLVRSFLPQTGCKDWGRGQVLITTQDASAIPTSAPHTYHELLSAGMRRDDALQLLKEVSQIVFSHELAEEVLEVLEFQPLALAAAAFYVNTVVKHGYPNYTWKNYLEVCSRGERESTEKRLAMESEAYSKTMTTSIKMALKTFSDREDVLRQTFLLFSLIASDPLPIEVAVDFVRARTSGNTDELIRAKIIKSTLITCLYNEDRSSGYLKVPTTVYKILKETSTSSFSERVPSICHAISAFHSLIESERGNLFQSPQVCVKLRRVTAHSKCLHNILTATFPDKFTWKKRLTSFITLNTIILWLSGTAAVCCDLSNPSDANLFSTSACELAVYSDGLVRAKALTVHGRVLMMSCNHKISNQVFERAIEIYKISDGVEHPKLSHCARHIEVLEYFEKALAIRKKTLGEEHTDVAESHNNLGVVYSHLAKYNEAKEHYEKALFIWKKTYGEEHADVAASYNNLGVVYGNLGKYSEAKEYLDKALIVRKKINKEEDAHVASSYNNLGTVFSHRGKYSKAKELYEKALFILKKIYYVGHKLVATIYHNLGIVCSQLGEYFKAKNYFKKARVIMKKSSDEVHSAEATSSINPGNIDNRLRSVMNTKYSKRKH